MKKFFIACITALLFFATASVALTVDLGTGSGSLLDNARDKAGYSANTSETTFSETLGTVVKAALSFVGVIFLALTVYAGFKWMNARGDEAEIEKSKEIIKSAIIGLIITVGAYSITAFVVPRVLERTAGPGGGDRVVGSPAGLCVYERTTFDEDGLTHRENVANRDECTAKCNTAGNTNCRFTPKE